jgi:flagellar basal body rod protein FlgB
MFGEGSSVSELKAGLDRSTESVRSIAHRIANASTPEAGDFASVMERVRADGTTEKVDLEREMVALAEEQIHFETASSLLQKVYQQVRSSLRSG